MGAGNSVVSSEAARFVQQTIQSNCVVIFSKTTCPYCTMAKQVFEKIHQPYKAVEINTREDGADIQNALSKMTGARTVPRVFVNGECIGGGSETKELHSQGKLVPLLQQCGEAESR